MEYGKKVNVGGFNYLKFKRNEMSFIKVTTIMGHWSMEWREDTLMYHALDSDLDKDQLAAVNVAIVNAFMCGCFLDGEFQHSVQVAAGELQERMNAEVKPLSDEEDAEVLSQLKAEHEMMETLGEELKEINEEQKQ